MSYNQATIELITKLVVESLQKYSEIPTKVPAGISARHLHLCRKDLDVLFGYDYKLNVLKPLSQPGQFAAEETVDLIGPKGIITKVRILGPERLETQVEVATSDARKLGIKPQVRASGNIKDTAGITIRGPKGEISISQGVIVAERHIHMTPNDAKNFNVQDGQKVSLLVEGLKGGALNNVVVRVSDKYALDCHIDTDDASAFLIQQGQMLKIKKNG